MRAMTSDNVLKFLGNREYLHQVSYQELKSLVVQYPYSLSLRYLLAMKSQQEDNTDVGRNIELLATYGIDRAHLHKIFSEDPIVLEDLEETVVMGEDFLELKELSTLERELEDTQFIKTESNLNFLEERTPTSNNELSILPETPTITTPIGVDSAEELETGLVEEEIVAKIEESIAEGSLETDTPLILDTPPEIVEEDEEEEFVEMDFESDLDTSEEIGIPSSIPEMAPSESFSANEGEFDEHGLPKDAIEVNDLFVDNQEIAESSLEELFDESEQEVIAEEAVSDSAVFIENPKEVLEKESHTALLEEENRLKEEGIAEDIENKSVVKEEITVLKPSIPFEISYTDTDPQAIEEIDSLADLAVPAPLPETIDTPIEEPIPQILEEEVIEGKVVEEIEEEPTKVEKEEAILPEEKKEVSPKPAAFKFDSLDQFEVALQESKLTQLSKPLPKTGFTSWQEKYSGVSTFSGINIDPISQNGGKIIKKKKKVVKKQFEETVAFAEESLKMDTHIVSETLAQLLVKQGQYSRARKMYQELSLTIPEKSSFFAAEIEKIQNLPDEDS